MKMHIDGYFDVPTPRTRFEREIRFVIGFFRGSSLVVTRYCDNYEEAVDKLTDLQFQYPERDYHLFETQIQTLCLV